MLQFVNTGLILFGTLFLLIAVFFLTRGLLLRGQAARQLYTVARQESRQETNKALLRGLLFLVLGIILLAVWALAPLDAPAVLPSPSPPSPTLTPTLQPATATPTFTPAPSDTPAPTAAPALTQTLTPTPTLVVTATQVFTPTPTVDANIAIVNSPNGLYVRQSPDGAAAILVLSPNGTPLTLLAGQQTIDGQVWQQVRTPEGVEGWAAAAFLTYPPGVEP